MVIMVKIPGLGDLPSSFSNLPTKFIPGKSYWGFKYTHAPHISDRIMGKHDLHSFKKGDIGFYKVDYPDHEIAPQEVHTSLSYLAQPGMPKLSITAQHWVGPFKTSAMYMPTERSKHFGESPPISIKGKQIHLYPEDKTEVPHTHRHELGHALWNAAPASYRRQYKRMASNDKSNIPPSLLGRKNVGEDFAEAVAYSDPEYVGPLKNAPEYEGTDDEWSRGSRREREKLLRNYPGGLPNMYPGELKTTIPKDYRAGEMKGRISTLGYGVRGTRYSIWSPGSSTSLFTANYNAYSGRPKVPVSAIPQDYRSAPTDEETEAVYQATRKPVSLTGRRLPSGDIDFKSNQQEREPETAVFSIIPLNKIVPEFDWAKDEALMKKHLVFRSPDQDYRGKLKGFLSPYEASERHFKKYGDKGQGLASLPLEQKDAGSLFPPVHVRDIGNDQYTLTDGHHRYSAAKLTGLTEVTAWEHRTGKPSLLDPYNVGRAHSHGELGLFVIPEGAKGFRGAPPKPVFTGKTFYERDRSEAETYGNIETAAGMGEVYSIKKLDEPEEKVNQSRSPPREKDLLYRVWYWRGKDLENSEPDHQTFKTEKEAKEFFTKMEKENRSGQMPEVLREGVDEYGSPEYQVVKELNWDRKKEPKEESRGDRVQRRQAGDTRPWDVGLNAFIPTPKNYRSHIIVDGERVRADYFGWQVDAKSKDNKHVILSTQGPERFIQSSEHPQEVGVPAVSVRDGSGRPIEQPAKITNISLGPSRRTISVEIPTPAVRQKRYEAERERRGIEWDMNALPKGEWKETTAPTSTNRFGDVYWPPDILGRPVLQDFIVARSTLPPLYANILREREKEGKGNFLGIAKHGGKSSREEWIDSGTKDIDPSKRFSPDVGATLASTTLLNSLLPSFKMQAFERKHGDTRGSYNKLSGLKLYAHDFGNTGNTHSTPNVPVHELGHVIHQEVRDWTSKSILEKVGYVPNTLAYAQRIGLTKEQWEELKDIRRETIAKSNPFQSRWEQISKADRLKGGTPSLYGTKNENEDFTESFVQYIKGGPLTPERKVYFEDLEKEFIARGKGKFPTEKELAAMSDVPKEYRGAEPSEEEATQFAERMEDATKEKLYRPGQLYDAERSWSMIRRYNQTQPGLGDIGTDRMEEVKAAERKRFKTTSSPVPLEFNRTSFTAEPSDDEVGVLAPKPIHLGAVGEMPRASPMKYDAYKGMASRIGLFPLEPLERNDVLELSNAERIARFKERQDTQMKVVEEKREIQKQTEAPMISSQFKPEPIKPIISLPVKPQPPISPVLTQPKNTPVPELSPNLTGAPIIKPFIDTSQFSVKTGPSWVPETKPPVGVAHTLIRLLPDSIRRKVEVGDDKMSGQPESDVIRLNLELSKKKGKDSQFPSISKMNKPQLLNFIDVSKTYDEGEGEDEIKQLEGRTKKELISIARTGVISEPKGKIVVSDDHAADLRGSQEYSFNRFDLSKLKKLGAGSSRRVYDLGEGKVLKVASTKIGLLQNDPEGDYAAPVPERLERGKDYVIVEKVDIDKKKAGKLVQEIKDETLKQAAKMDKRGMRDVDNYAMNRAFEVLDKRHEKEGYDLSSLINYSVLPGDVTRISSWGFKKEQPMLLDAGTLDKRIAEKDYQKEATVDWREILREKSAAKKREKKEDELAQHLAGTPWATVPAMPGAIRPWVNAPKVELKTNLAPTDELKPGISPAQFERDVGSDILYSGKKVGMIRAYPDDEDNAEVRELEIEPKYQGRGIGTQVVSQVFDRYGDKPLYGGAFKSGRPFWKAIGSELSPPEYDGFSSFTLNKDDFIASQLAKNAPGGEGPLNPPEIQVPIQPNPKEWEKAYRQARLNEVIARKKYSRKPSLETPQEGFPFLPDEYTFDMKKGEMRHLQADALNEFTVEPVGMTTSGRSVQKVEKIKDRYMMEGAPEILRDINKETTDIDETADVISVEGEDAFAREPVMRANPKVPYKSLLKKDAPEMTDEEILSELYPGGPPDDSAEAILNSEPEPQPVEDMSSEEPSETITNINDGVAERRKRIADASPDVVKPPWQLQSK